MRVMIVGGVAGGMSAATRLRRLDNDAEIIVIERSGHVSYANCGLPYFVGGVIEREESLLLQTPASLHERFRIDVRVNSEVLSIDPATRSVRVRDLTVDDDYELTYDRLVLSPGASPVIPAIPGIERAMALRTVEDVEHMVAAVERSPRHAVVIGGGFIGDYTGLAVGSDNVFHAFWTDTNEKQDVVWFYGFEFVPTSINQEDVVTASGTIP